ncbi:MAG: F420-0--gamma-glutamyl ligase [Negativicutes bacterium]|nr:F420-0--gamma-glutamyl ligase [Negativicutes bacterium]
MVRMVGTVVRGLRTPMIKEGDNIIDITVDAVLAAAASEGFTLRDRDVIGIKESIVARSQGNYATVEDIGADIKRKFAGSIAVVFPVLSRNRFSVLLKGIAASGRKIYMFLNYPADELGNHLMDVEKMDDLGLNPSNDVFTEEQYRTMFGNDFMHQFTGIDYVNHYREMAGDNIEFIFTNNPRHALRYSKEVLVAGIHERDRVKRILLKAGAEKVFSLDEILAEPVNGGGYNEQYGLLGSNMAAQNTIKLFPRNCQKVVNEIQKKLKVITGKNIEVMVFGDGGFKDPAGRIWELADPVISPGFTAGLQGVTSEIKIKYIVDSEFNHLSSDEMAEAVKKKINGKIQNMLGKEESLGTTPRQITDLLGSLFDLTSGSGDKGTPVVLVQGYFDNYATE